MPNTALTTTTGDTSCGMKRGNNSSSLSHDAPALCPPAGAPRETREARTPLWLGICWRALHTLPRFVYLSRHPHGKMSRL